VYSCSKKNQGRFRHVGSDHSLVSLGSLVICSTTFVRVKKLSFISNVKLTLISRKKKRKIQIICFKHHVCVLHETKTILSEAFPHEMDNKGVIRGNNVKWFILGGYSTTGRTHSHSTVRLFNCQNQNIPYSCTVNRNTTAHIDRYMSEAARDH
jgi:hypothetical protein